MSITAVFKNRWAKNENLPKIQAETAENSAFDQALALCKAQELQIKELVELAKKQQIVLEAQSRELNQLKRSVRPALAKAAPAAPKSAAPAPAAKAEAETATRRLLERLWPRK